MKYFLILFLSVLISCQPAGTSFKLLDGNESNLPDDLKGLKVYRVYYNESGDNVLVAVRHTKVNSITYSSGKFKNTVLMVDSTSNILYENDSIIIIKKH